MYTFCYLVYALLCKFFSYTVNVKIKPLKKKSDDWYDFCYNLTMELLLVYFPKYSVVLTQLEYTVSSLSAFHLFKCTLTHNSIKKKLCRCRGLIIIILEKICTKREYRLVNTLPLKKYMSSMHKSSDCKLNVTAGLIVWFPFVHFSNSGSARQTFSDRLESWSKRDFVNLLRSEVMFSDDFLPICHKICSKSNSETPSDTLLRKTGEED